LSNGEATADIEKVNRAASAKIAIFFIVGSPLGCVTGMRSTGFTSSEWAKRGRNAHSLEGLMWDPKLG
jgi:hypothetical protein